MADSNKLIGIFPETGESGLLPRIEFTGKDNKKVSLQTEDNNDLHFVNASGDSLLRITTSGLIVASGGDSVKWNEAYGWGDHSTSGYALDNIVVKTTGDQTISGDKTFQSSILLNAGDAATGGVANLTLDGATGSTLFFDNNFLTGFDRTESNLLFYNFAGGYLEIESNNNIAFRTNSTERINITNSGNVGIGVSDPNAKLEIYSAASGDTLFNIEGTNGNLFSVVDSTSGSLMSVNDITGLPAFEVFSDHSIVAGRFNSNDFVISSDGDVGIGTATPSGKLDVRGNVYFGDPNTTNNLYIRTSGLLDTRLKLRTDIYQNLYLDATNAYVKVGNSSADVDIIAGNAPIRIGNNALQTAANQYILFKPSNTEAMRITSSGNVLIGVGSGDYRFQVYGSGNDALFGYSDTGTAGGKVKIYVGDNDSNNQGLKVYNGKTTGSNFGVNGTANGSGALVNYGVYGWGAEAATNYGVYAYAANGTNNYALYGYATGGSNNRGLWVDAGYAIFDDSVGIGTGNPVVQLDVVGSGNFSQSLTVNNIPVSVSGHTHTSSDITDFVTSVNALLPIANKQIFNVTSAQTTFTPSNPYTIGAIDVYYNGVKLISGTDFTASNGTTIVFSTPAISGSIVEVVSTAASVSYQEFLQSQIIHPFLLGGI